MIPHLIHIGLPKTGSTWLQSWFQAHPQIAYTSGGIGGFADIDHLSASAPESGAGIRCRVTSNANLTAPLTSTRPETLDYDRSGRAPIAEEQARICETLAGLFPGATILIVTRGFRSMMMSAYSQYVRTGGTEALADVLAGPPRDYPWDYDRLIRLYRNGFGTKKLLVLPYELLRDDPARFLGEIERHLGLDHMPFALSPANVSASPVELGRYPAMTRIVDRLPIARRAARRLYARLLYRGRLRRVAGLLHSLAPAAPPRAEMIDDSFLDQFRGKADSLLGDPLYASYAADYLITADRECASAAAPGQAAIPALTKACRG